MSDAKQLSLLTLAKSEALAKAEAQRTIKIPLSDREKAIVERLGRHHGGAV